ncbi:cysteinyl-tRNA synthetase, class Ia family protein [Artemisia annua]|uniref:cysteine--tRNA ligase n=1 Tax=Artemisia annua TaxID=35608 RepID=A0A2U1KIP9_ARTAN|nr:cysteinyl-tRNA synthetase, class Ia family protein [Artemisia annua]
MDERRREMLKIYNTLTKRKEVFKPNVEGKVWSYVCGITPYDYSHMGHARAYVFFDLLHRHLKDYLGYQVKYVRNFTDIDDKIIKRANGGDPLALSARFSQEFLTDMADLQCLPPTQQPRVSDHMDQIKDMIAKIINNGCAYVVEGDVYFSVKSSPNYGCLSGRNSEDNRAGERIVIDPRKKNPADFALWKAAKDGEISWDSPWGKGRPGWHIECSALSATYLTEKFDIHGGGMDLIFPHHENEIAQNCAACPDSKINYWMHNGFVTANNEKMSKSTGNFFTIHEVTNLYHALALRHFLMGTHYRSPVNYSISQIEISSEAIFYIYQKYPVTDDAKTCITNLKTMFEEKMSDDLHTPTILNAALPDALRFMNTILSNDKKELRKQEKMKSKSQQPSESKPHKLSNDVGSLIELMKEVRKILNVLGLLSSLTYTEVLKQLKDKALKRAELTEVVLLQRIEERVSARKNKDFLLADQIRTDLTSKGIALMDVIGKDTVWRPCVPVKQAGAHQTHQMVNS